RRYGDVAGVNRAYHYTLQRLSLAFPPFEEPAEASWRDPDNARYRDWREFKANLPPSLCVPVSGDAAWRGFLRRKYEDLSGLNRGWRSGHSAWTDVLLPATETEAGEAARRDW